MLSARALWPLVRTKIVDGSQLLPRVVCADGEGLPGAPYWPNSSRRCILVRVHQCCAADLDFSYVQDLAPLVALTA